VAKEGLRPCDLMLLCMMFTRQSDMGYSRYQYFIYGGASCVRLSDNDRAQLDLTRSFVTVIWRHLALRRTVDATVHLRPILRSS
jgi:hypothetical protein